MKTHLSQPIVILRQTVQSELLLIQLDHKRLVVNLVKHVLMAKWIKTYIVHILSADLLHVARESGSEHHHLLLLRTGNKHTLHLHAHLRRVHNVIALINHEMLQFVQLQNSSRNQIGQTTRSTNHNGRM